MYLFFFSQKDKVKNIFQSCVHFLKTCKYLHFSQNHFHSSLWVSTDDGRFIYSTEAQFPKERPVLS